MYETIFEINGVPYKHKHKKEMTDAERYSLVNDLEASDAFNPEAQEQEQRSRAVNLADPQLLESARRFMTKEDGNFTLDGAVDYYKMPDEEVIDQYYERMRHYNINTGSVLKLAAGLGGDTYDDGDRQALRYMWDTWDNTVPFYKDQGTFLDGVVDVLEAVGTDPVNYAGLATFGTATAVGQSGKFIARKGVEEFLKRSLPQATKIGAIEGGVIAGSHTIGQENVEESIGKDDFSWGDVATNTALGTVAGGVFGNLFKRGEGLFHNSVNNWKGKGVGKQTSKEIAEEVKGEVKTKLGYDGDLDATVVTTSKLKDGTTQIIVSDKTTLSLVKNGKQWELSNPAKPDEEPQVFKKKGDAIAKANEDALNVKTKRATGFTAQQLRDQQDILTKEAMGETLNAAEKLALQQSDPTRLGKQRQKDFKEFVAAMDGQTALRFKIAGALKKGSKEREMNTQEALRDLKIDADNFDLDDIIKKLTKNGGGLDKKARELATFGINIEEMALRRLQKSANENSADFAEHFSAYGVIASKNKAVGASAGSVLQQQKNRFRMSAEEQVAFMDAVMKAPDAATVAKLIDEIEGKPAKYTNKFIAGANEFFVHNILSAASTMYVNQATSLAKATMRNMELSLGGLIRGDKVAMRMGAIRFVSEASQTINAAKMALKTLQESRTQTVQRNYTELANDSQENIIGRDYRMSEGLATLTNRDKVTVNEAGETVLGVENGGVLAGAWNLVGNLNRVLGKRVMFATDEFVKASSFRGSLKGSYVNKYMEEGMGFFEAFSRAEADVDARYIQHLREQADGVVSDDPFVKKAINDANENTFQQDMADDVFGFFGKGLNTIRGEHPWITQFAPFIRTPTNLLSYVGDRTPILQNLSKTFQAKLNSRDPLVAAEAQGALMFGTAFWGGAMAMAMSGNLTGKGPKEKGRRNTWKANGNIPYAIVNDDGSQTAISRLAPYAHFMMVTGQIHDNIAYRGQEEAREFYANLALTTAMTVLQQPQLQGLLGAVEVFTGDTGNIISRGENLATKQLSGYAPFYRVYEELVGYGLMEQMEMTMPEMHQLSLALEAKPSALSLLNDGWHPSGDIKRNPINGAALIKSNPINSWGIPDGAPKHDPNISDEDREVFYEIDRLGMSISQPAYRSSHLGDVDMRTFWFNEGESNQSVYDKYQELVGTITMRTRNGERTLMENLYDTINTDAYVYDGTETFRQVSTVELKGTKDKTIKSVIDAYRLHALEHLRRTIPSDHPIFEKSNFANAALEREEERRQTQYEANRIFHKGGN